MSATTLTAVSSPPSTVPIRDMLARYLMCSEIMRITDGSTDHQEWTDASNESCEIEREIKARMMRDLGLSRAELDLIGRIL